jgi:hypothetical protein
MVAYTFIFKEKFTETGVEKETYVKSADTASKDPTVMSNGTVQKYNEDGIYTYNMFFNLPSLVSTFQTTNLDLPFNYTGPEPEYIVKMGSSEFDLVEVGILTRRQDGYYTLEIKTGESYSKVCVYLNDTLVNCVDF